MVAIASPVPDLMAVPQVPSGTCSVIGWALYHPVPTADLTPLSLIS